MLKTYCQHIKNTKLSSKIKKKSYLMIFIVQNVSQDCPLAGLQILQIRWIQQLDMHHEEMLHL